MKEVIYPLLCALAFFSVESCAASVSEHDKAVKAKVGELRKEGWKVVGDGDLTELVSAYEEKKAAEGKKTNERYSGFIGIGTDCSSIDSGKAAAREDAPKLFVKFIVDDMRAACDRSPASDPKLEVFYDNFESICSAKIASELVPSFYLYNKLDNEKYMVAGYFLLNAVRALELYSAAINEAENIAGIKFKHKSAGTADGNIK